MTQIYFDDCVHYFYAVTAIRFSDREVYSKRRHAILEVYQEAGEPQKQFLWFCERQLPKDYTDFIKLFDTIRCEPVINRVSKNITDAAVDKRLPINWVQHIDGWGI